VAPVLNTAFEMAYRVKSTHPVGPTKGSPRGSRQFKQVAQGSLSGPGINTLLFSTGVDWINSTRTASGDWMSERNF